MEKYAHSFSDGGSGSSGDYTTIANATINITETTTYFGNLTTTTTY